DQLAPVRHRVLLRRVARAAAGVVHQDVDPAEVRDDAVDQSDAPRRVCEVGLHAEEPPAERLDAAARLPVVAGERDPGGGRARPGKAARHRLPQAAARARHKRHAAVESELLQNHVRDLKNPCSQHPTESRLRITAALRARTRNAAWNTSSASGACRRTASAASRTPRPYRSTSAANAASSRPAANRSSRWWSGRSPYARAATRARGLGSVIFHPGARLTDMYPAGRRRA